MNAQSCAGCGYTVTKRYVIALAHDEGQMEGQHVADIEIHLCEDCEERAGDVLLTFPMQLECEVAEQED